MMKNSLFIVLILVSGRICAQDLMDNIMIFKGEYTPHMNSAIIRDSTVVDTASVALRYRFFKEGRWCDIAVQVGTAVVKQQDLLRYCVNRQHTAFARGQGPNDRPGADGTEAFGNIGSDLFSELFYSFDTDTITVFCGDYFRSNRMRCYRQPRPKLQWTLREGRREILGYECLEAAATYGGRDWTAWYAPEIPLSLGPWKLSGLPGMILAADCGEAFAFECIEIKTCEEPVAQYTYKPLHRFRDFAEFLHYQRTCHEEPYASFTQGRPGAIYTTDAAGKLISLDESWTIPYNPIERE